jgi:hypothetical protein
MKRIINGCEVDWASERVFAELQDHPTYGYLFEVSADWKRTVKCVHISSTDEESDNTDEDARRFVRRYVVRRGVMQMRRLRPACLAVAFVALAVPSSAQTSLTPGQSAKIYRTVIPQGRGRAPIVRQRIVIKLVVPMPLPRERIEDYLAQPKQPQAQNNALVNEALAVPDASANTGRVLPVVNETSTVRNASANTAIVALVNGALAVAEAPADTDTVPAKFSPKNAADDELITIARTFKMLTKDERLSIYEALKHGPAPNIGTKLPPGIELYPVPAEIAARVPQIRDYHYAVVKDRVLLVGTGRIVAASLRTHR